MVMIVSKEQIEILESIPKDFYGANLYDHHEVEAVSKIINGQSPFRYYGNNLYGETDKFEDACKRYFSMNYAHTVNSGTGALSCALHALDVGLGDEVIIPGYFWASVVNTTVLRGGIPVLCEVDETLNLNIEDLEKKITNKTKCIILIHMDGAQARVDEIRTLCDRYDVKILEDFSQCVGGSIEGKMIGSFGDVAIASLQLNKMISSGEGGLVLTNCEAYYYKMVARSDFGFQRKDGDIDSATSNPYITYGEGRRFNEIGGAIMNIQLQKLPDMIENMRNRKMRIKSGLGNISPIRYRTIVDEAGDTGSTLIMIFDSASDIDCFFSIYNTNYPKGELRLYRLSDTGYHIYYNCTNLVEKIDVLPNGFPWTFVESDNYSYEKGILPTTDDLLHRSIALKLPPNLTLVQEEVIIDSLKYLLQEFKNQLNNLKR